MDRFAGLVLKASQTLGAPLYVAAHLGVEPYDIYRWIAGTQLPEPTRRQSLEQRLLSILDGKLERKPQAAQGSTPERRWRDRRVFQPSESIATASSQCLFCHSSLRNPPSSVDMSPLGN